CGDDASGRYDPHLAGEPRSVGWRLTRPGLREGGRAWGRNETGGTHSDQTENGELRWKSGRAGGDCPTGQEELKLGEERGPAGQWDDAPLQNHCACPGLAAEHQPERRKPRQDRHSSSSPCHVASLLATSRLTTSMDQAIRSPDQR